jgi:hypothetical protein
MKDNDTSILFADKFVQLDGIWQRYLLQEIRAIKEHSVNSPSTKAEKQGYHTAEQHCPSLDYNH